MRSGLGLQVIRDDTEAARSLGIGTLPGPVAGVIVFYALQRALADYGTIYLILLGLIGIAIMLFARRGLWGVFSDRTGIDFLPLRQRPPKGPQTQQATPNENQIHKTPLWKGNHS